MNDAEKFNELTSDFCTDKDRACQMVGRLMATKVLDILRDRVIDDLEDRRMPPEEVIKAYTTFFATIMCSIVEFTQPRPNQTKDVHEYVSRLFAGYMSYDLEVGTKKRKKSHE